MPAENDETKVKEFLDRTEIRTMKKDLQKLREGVALKERERIIKIKTPEEEKTEKERQERIKQQEIEKQLLEKQSQERIKVLQKRAGEEKEAMAQIKNYATEEEKQQIFYLESEKNDLTKQLQALQKEKEPPLLLQKNKLILARKDIEDKLKINAEEEKTIENEQKFISESEKTTNVPQDKQKLEKRRWELETKREEMERKRWTTEKELEKIEKQIKNNDEEYQKVLTEQKSFKDRIAKIDESLKSVYVGIMGREEEKKRMAKEKRDVESLKRAEEQGKRMEEIRRQEWLKKGKVEEKPFLKEIPGAKKEGLMKKMEETLDKEEEERRKFLESIEKWTEEENK